MAIAKTGSAKPATPAKPVPGKTASAPARPAVAAKPQTKPTVPGARVAAAPPAEAPPSAPGRVSFNPDTFTSGGLIDDIDAEITDALTCEWDYNGQQAAGPALAVEFTDNNGAGHIQYYSAGKAEDWKATEDGESFEPVSGKSGINNQTNLGMFIASLVEAGFPKEMLGDSMKVIIGTKVHVLQKQLERKGLVRTGPNASRPSSVLLVSKILQLPTGAGVPATASTTKAAGTVHGANGVDHSKDAATPAAAEVSDIDTLIAEAIAEAVVNSETQTIDKKDVGKVLYAKATENNMTPQERSKLIVRAGSQDFLKNVGAFELDILGGMKLVYDGASITLGE